MDDPGKLLGDITTDQSGAPKPMLAKSFDGVATSTFEHEFYGSTKIDGTRCLMH
nr:MAG TPA: DNA ligase [Bacteriophage sp.]DAQ87998.1 MAG TPA: DNA ligase [Caudoviricetes sp.]